MDIQGLPSNRITCTAYMGRSSVSEFLIRWTSFTKSSRADASGDNTKLGRKFHNPTHGTMERRHPEDTWAKAKALSHEPSLPIVHLYVLHAACKQHFVCARLQDAFKLLRRQLVPVKTWVLQCCNALHERPGVARAHVRCHMSHVVSW
jgi:hypothetical protein